MDTCEIMYVHAPASTAATGGGGAVQITRTEL